MRTTTAVNHQLKLRSDIDDIFARARTLFYTHDKLMEVTDKEIWSCDEYQIIPRWTRAYVRGYYDAMYAAHWSNVKWVLPWAGKLYESYMDMLAEGKEFYRGKDVNGFHVYKSDETKHYTGKKEYYLRGLENVDAVEKSESS